MNKASEGVTDKINRVDTIRDFNKLENLVSIVQSR